MRLAEGGRKFGKWLSGDDGPNSVVVVRQSRSTISIAPNLGTAVADASPGVAGAFGAGSLYLVKSPTKRRSKNRKRFLKLLPDFS